MNTEPVLRRTTEKGDPLRVTTVGGAGKVRFMQDGNAYGADESFLGKCNDDGTLKAVERVVEKVVVPVKEPKKKAGRPKKAE